MTAMPKIQDLEDSTFDPILADELMFGDHTDPYSRIEEFRAGGPVIAGDYRSMMGLPSDPFDPAKPRYTVLSHTAVETALHDPETFSNRSFEPSLGVVYGPILTVLDPPVHTGYRRILQRAFRPEMIRAWERDYVEPVLAELIVGLHRSNRAELISQYTRPYPFGVIYRLIGLPHEDEEVFYRLTVAQLVSSYAMDIARDAAVKLDQYFAALMAERRARPGTDIVSAIATAESEGETLPDDIAISFLRQLLSAGGETGFRTLSVLLCKLLTQPGLLDELRANRSLIPAAVEETLRWEGPVVTTTRETTRDVVLDGVPLPAGAHLDICLGGANRDPAKFADPARFDLHRPRRQHFGFASGIHNCIGQQLARLEIVKGVEALLDNFPDIRLDPDAPPPIVRGTTMRIPRELHVVFDT